MGTAAVLSMALASAASAQTVINNPQPAPAQTGTTVVNNPPPAQAQPGTTIVNNPPAQQPQSVVVEQPAAAAPAAPALVARDDSYEYRPRRGLVIGGATLFGVTYLGTVLGAAIASDVCDANSSLGCRSAVWPIYIPIIGPFIQMGYIDGTGSNTGRALLGIDGALQATGVALFAVGLATGWRHRTATVVSQKIQITPYSGSNGAGLVAVGRF